MRTFIFTKAYYWIHLLFFTLCFLSLWFIFSLYPQKPNNTLIASSFEARNNSEEKVALIIDDNKSFFFFTKPATQPSKDSDFYFEQIHKEDSAYVNKPVQISSTLFSDIVGFWSSQKTSTYGIYNDPWGNWNIVGVPWIAPFPLFVIVLLWIMFWKYQSQMNTEIERKNLLLTASKNAKIDLARTLHDGPIQELNLFGLEVQKYFLQSNAPTEVKEHLKQLQKRTEEELRRICAELRPTLFENLGFAEGLTHFITQKQNEYPKITFTFQHSEITNFPPSHYHSTYYIIREAIQNAIKHGQPSHIRIKHKLTKDENIFTITNDGKTIDAPQDFIQLAKQGHYGLLDMQDRAQEMKGSIALNSDSANLTTLTLTIPK